MYIVLRMLIILLQLDANTYVQDTVKIIIVAHVLMPWLVRTMGQVALSSTNKVVDNPLAAPGTII